MQTNVLLNQTETFFIDLNVLLSTDLFVVDQIYKYLFRMNDTEDEFYEIKTAVEHPDIGYNKLSTLLQFKTHINPLYDFMRNPNREVADMYYNGILFDDSHDYNVYYRTMVKTKIGAAMHALINDNGVQTVYVAHHTFSQNMMNFIKSTFPCKEKWQFVVGNKWGFLDNHKCTQYFVNDITDVLHIANRRHDLPSSIYVTAHSYNMFPEMPIVLNTPIKAEVLDKEFNIKLNSIGLPIF